MSVEPLIPFTGLPVSISISTGALVGWILVTAFAFWALYTIIGIYHWVKFSHAAAVAYPAIIIHLAVSGVIILVALSALVV